MCDFEKPQKELLMIRLKPFEENKDIEPVIDYDLKKIIKDTTNLFESIHILKDHIDFYKILIERLKLIKSLTYNQPGLEIYEQIDVYKYATFRRPLIRMIINNIEEQFKEKIYRNKTAKKIIELIEKMIVKINIKYEELYKLNTEKRIEKKREFGNTRVTCEHCNKEYTKAHKARHLKQCKEIKK